MTKSGTENVYVVNCFPMYFCIMSGKLTAVVVAALRKWIVGGGVIRELGLPDPF